MHKHKAAALLALSSFVIPLASTPALATASTITDVTSKTISINGQVVSRPFGFTANGTAYMPIWHVMQMLKSLNIQSTWDGTNWELSLPANVVPDYTNLDGSAGNKAIYLNGKAVERVDGIAYTDPSSHTLTTYMPVWYVQRSLQRIGVQYQWDGTHWDMTYAAPATGSAENYNIHSVNIAQDQSVIVHSSGFYTDTTYIALDDLSAALMQMGIPTYRSGNAWYINASQGAGATTGPVDATQPVVLFDEGQPVASSTVVAASGQIYYPLWRLMQALKTDGLYTNWDGKTFSMSRNNIYLHDIVNPHQKYTYSQMEQDIQSLAATYPDLVHYQVLGQTAYGRNLYAVSIGKGQAAAFINGSHHAREWITTNLNMYMVDQYAQAYEKNQSIESYNVRQVLDNTTLWFMPMVNPDGVTLEQFGASAFPSDAQAGLVEMNNGSGNFTHWKANAQGIDPNRQYDGGWAGIWYDPVKRPWYQDYKGTAPYSINEAKAVLKLIAQVNPQMEIAYHASGGLIYYAYKVSGSQYSADLGYAQTLRSMTGYPLQYPTSNPSGGGLTDWWTHNVGRPGFTIEVGPSEGENPVPTGYFDGIWSKNKAIGLYLAAESAKLYAQHPTDVVTLP